MIPRDYEDEKICWGAMHDIAQWLGFPVPSFALEEGIGLYFEYQLALIAERERIFNRAIDV